MIGLSEDSQIREKIMKTAKEVVRYSIVEQRIDIGDLQLEKQSIEQQLEGILSDEKLLEWARQNYIGNNVNGARLRARLHEINLLLGE